MAAYKKGQEHCGPYTDSKNHHTPSPMYDEAGNMKGMKSGGMMGDIESTSGHGKAAPVSKERGRK